MLAGRHEESVALADEAIALAASVGAPGPRASALITRATAMANAGAYDSARRGLREAIGVLGLDFPFELSRAHINLGSVLLDLGDVAGAIGTAREGVALSRADRDDRGLRAVRSRQPRRGALPRRRVERVGGSIVREGLEHALRTGGQYHEPLFHFVLGELGLARDGRVDHAVDSAGRIVDLARRAGDDQTVFPSFAVAAWLLARIGRASDAETLVDDLLARRRANPTGLMPGYWTTYVALTLDAIGRRGALRALDAPEGSRFLEAALAIDDGRFDRCRAYARSDWRAAARGRDPSSRGACAT